MQTRGLCFWLLLCVGQPAAAQPESQGGEASHDEIAAPIDAGVGQAEDGGESTQTFDIFIPSESIAEDLAVPFPVDI